MSSDPQDVNAAVEAAVAAATRAPSIHNTQPWRFRVDADRVELLADLSRQLSVLDPTGRQLYLSCGAALHHLRVALRAAGYRTEVTLLPADADGPGGTRVMASVAVRPGEPGDAAATALADAIAERHTQREPFAERKVEHETLTALRRAAEDEGGWLALLEHREDQITLAVLLSHANSAELSDPEYQRELHEWLRVDPAYDGVPASALPSVGDGRHSEVVIRDFAAGEGETDVEVSEDSIRLPDERPALVILGTDTDTPQQWLVAGQALSHLLLTATTLGLRASMLGQVIDLPGTREQLRRELRLVGEPQMVLRVGYGPAAPATPRRPLTEVLES